jgi:hypothetical protein
MFFRPGENTRESHPEKSTTPAFAERAHRARFLTTLPRRPHHAAPEEVLGADVRRDVESCRGPFVL